MANNKKLTIRVTAEDAASGIFSHIGERAEGLERKLKAIGKASDTKAFKPLEEVFGAGAKLGLGGFALAGVAIGADYAERGAEALTELSIAYRNGTKSNEEFLDSLTRSVPVLGAVYAAIRGMGGAMRELVTGERAYMEAVSEQDDRDRAAYAERKKPEENARSESLSYYDDAKKAEQQRYVSAAAPADRPFIQAGYDYQNQSYDAAIKLQKQIKDKTDAADREVAKLQAIQSGQIEDLERYFIDKEGASREDAKAKAAELAKDDRFQKIKSALLSRQSTSVQGDYLAAAAAGPGSTGPLDASFTREKREKAAEEALADARSELDKQIKDRQTFRDSEVGKLQAAAGVNTEEDRRAYLQKLEELERQKAEHYWETAEASRLASTQRLSQQEADLLTATGHTLDASIKQRWSATSAVIGEARTNLQKAFDATRDRNSPEYKSAEQALLDAMRGAANTRQITAEMERQAVRSVTEQGLQDKVGRIDNTSSMEDRRDALKAQFDLIDQRLDKKYEDRSTSLADAFKNATSDAQKKSLQAQINSLASDKAADRAFERRQAANDATARIPMGSALADTIDARGLSGLALRAQEEQQTYSPFRDMADHPDKGDGKDPTAKDIAATADNTGKIAKGIGDLIKAIASLPQLSPAPI